MLLTLDRQPSWHDTTLGVLFVDGARECYTLEDEMRRGAKVPGQTAIPAGRYRLIVTWSPKFHRLLPLLVDVPGYEGIRIHCGNTADDTEGCIILGDSVVDAGRVANSRVAFDRLYPKILTAQKSDDGCWIVVRDPLEAQA